MAKIQNTGRLSERVDSGIRNPRRRPGGCLTDRKKKLEKLGAKIDPALKDWIDHVIVPGLVRQCIVREKQKTIGLKFRVVSHSPAHETSGEGSK